MTCHLRRRGNKNVDYLGITRVQGRWRGSPGVTREGRGHRSPLKKLTQGKNWHIDTTFLETNFERFRLLTVRNDTNY